jgi:hypothetical protein
MEQQQGMSASMTSCTARFPASADLGAGIAQVQSVTGRLHPLGNPRMANGMQYDGFFCKRGLFVR